MWVLVGLGAPPKISLSCFFSLSSCACFCSGTHRRVPEEPEDDLIGWRFPESDPTVVSVAVFRFQNSRLLGRMVGAKCLGCLGSSFDGDLDTPFSRDQQFARIILLNPQTSLNMTSPRFLTTHVLF